MRNPLQDQPVTLGVPPIVTRLRILSEHESLQEECAECAAKTFSDALLVANHQIRAGSSPLPLIRTESFAGPCSQITTTARGALLYGERVLNFGLDKASVLNDNEAASRLSTFCPLVKRLSFEGYCIAGGASAWAVRKTGHEATPSDIDVFCFVNPALSDTDKHLRAAEIYTHFLREIEQIYDDYFKPTHYLSYFRNKSCTTVELMNKDYPADAMKLQFIHSAYESVAHVLGSFDLAASQVAYDGRTFHCTYIAMLALHTGVLLLDFSRISASWQYRLRKYSEEKGFAVLALGLSTKLISGKGTEFQRGVVLSLTHFPRLPTARNKMAVQLSFSFDRPSVTAEGQSVVRGMFESKSDYHGDEDHILGLQALARTNVKNILHGRPMLVTASSVERFVDNAHGTNTAYPWPMFEAILERIKQTGVTKRPMMQYLYGDGHCREALACCNGENWTALAEVTKRRIEELQPLMEQGFAECKSVHWSLCKIGSPRYGAFNPQPLKSRDFYGQHHNGTYSTPTGQQKIAFIWAMKQRNASVPALLKLPKDLILLIVYCLDHIAVTEAVNKAMGWSLC
jgi:hypothetical protein